MLLHQSYLQMLVAISFVFLCAGAQQGCEGGTCDVQEQAGPETGSLLLQKQRSKVSDVAAMAIEEDDFAGAERGAHASSIDDIGAELSDITDQPLNDTGLNFVLGQCCMLTLDAYMRRLLFSLNLEICDQGCYNGFFQNFHCETGPSLDNVTAEIFANINEDCWCFANAGECGVPGSGPGQKPRNCSEFEDAGPINPTHHRRRQCGPSAATNELAAPMTVGPCNQSCELPAAVHEYSLITQGNAIVNAHEIYKGLAIGGTLTDGTPTSATAVGGASIAKEKTAGGNWQFASGFTVGDITDIFDWSHFMWLAQNLAGPTSGEYIVRIFKTGGTFSSGGVGGWKNWEGQGEDNGKTLMVFKTNEDVHLVKTNNGRQFGPSVLAPFSTVTLHGNAGFADGFIIAKEFGTSDKFSVGANPGQLQLHGDSYNGPLECKAACSLLAVIQNGTSVGRRQLHAQ